MTPNALDGWSFVHPAPVRGATKAPPRYKAGAELQVRIAEKEVEQEKAFLAARSIHVADMPEMTDDELLAELT